MKASDRLQRERDVYAAAPVVDCSGELDVFDRTIFDLAIRMPEIDFLSSFLRKEAYGQILDFGCGAGWLSKILSDMGFTCVGIDVSNSLCSHAMNASPTSSIMVGDCLRLPFREGAFDCVVGVAILHHLQVPEALSECHRVVRPGGLCLFLEPSSRNPFSSVANKRLVLSTHTPDERPLSERQLFEAMKVSGWQVVTMRSKFTFGFAFSYMFRLVDPDQSNPHKRKIGQAIRYMDALLERHQVMSEFGSTICVVARAI